MEQLMMAGITAILAIYGIFYREATKGHKVNIRYKEALQRKEYQLKRLNERS